MINNRVHEAGWWPCDRCGGSLPGADSNGQELSGPPVRATLDGYRCGPCRGLMTPLAPRANTSTGQPLVQQPHRLADHPTRRPVVTFKHVIPLRRTA